MKHFFKILIAILMTTAISATAKENPFFKEFDTQFGVPPFDKIGIEDYKPAFEEAIKIHDSEINGIVTSTSQPTFENVIAAMEHSGRMLDRVSTVFFNMMSANASPELQKLAQEISPMLSKHGDNIMLNQKLFERVKFVYDKKNALKLTSEQNKLLKETYKNFVRSGALLNDSDKNKLRVINERLDLLTLNFGQNVLAETNGFKLILDKKEDLEGLPKSAIDAAAQTAEETGNKGKWVFTLHNPSWVPFMTSSAKRELREKMFRAYANRGNNKNEFDNNENIKQIVNLRLEKALLLGYKSHADYVLEESMAKKPENVNKLLNELWEYTKPNAQKEAGELQEIINRGGKNFKLEPWDWRYYSEKLREEKYNLNEEEIRPYFKLENVRDGIFELTKRLYGLTYTERKDIPKYHKDAVVYEVKKSDGSHLGIFYMDFFPRESKKGGAWMSSYRDQYKLDGKNITAIVTIVCNFSKPTKDKPALLTMDEVETFFHEFGHAMHGLLSKCEFKSLSGTAVPRDFVELPSQIMENWAFEPELLAHYAHHYKTGKIIPDSLITKIKNSSKFNQGFATAEYLAAALLDMKYHTITSPLSGNPIEFENDYLKSISLIPEIISRYRSTYYSHIFSGGYSAGYYSYIWSGVLDTDAFEAFKEKGIFDKTTADAFRTNILERGGTEDPMDLYVKFRGRQPDITPLLKKRGLK